MDKLEEAVNSRYAIQLEDIHDASGLLKRFLRQLPEHILTNEKRPVFEKIASSILRFQFSSMVSFSLIFWQVGIYLLLLSDLNYKEECGQFCFRSSSHKVDLLSKFQNLCFLFQTVHAERYHHVVVW